MNNVRVWFEKKGAVKYISHLDLTRCMSRALKLSGLPVWYTEGFNPRIYMTYAMPLSLGVSGERECMDIRLTEETAFQDVVQRLNRHLPDDIRVFHAARPEQKLDAVAFAEYEMRLETGDSQTLSDALTTLFSRETVTVLKHGKKGEKEVDIKPHFSHMGIEGEQPGFLTLRMRLPCGQEGSINPGMLLEALKRYQNLEPYAEITRKRLLTKDFSEIR